MLAELVWTPKAEEDLIEIHAFIALDRPMAADRVIDRLVSAAEALRRFPRLCERRSEIRPALPILTERPVLRVEIVRVLDGRRELPTLF